MTWQWSTVCLEAMWNTTDSSYNTNIRVYIKSSHHISWYILNITRFQIFSPFPMFWPNNTHYAKCRRSVSCRFISSSCRFRSFSLAKRTLRANKYATTSLISCSVVSKALIMKISLKSHFTVSINWTNVTIPTRQAERETTRYDKIQQQQLWTRS